MSKPKEFKNRREQIEQDLLPCLFLKLRKSGCVLNAEAKAAIAEEMKYAAMVGAAEERGRALRAINTMSDVAAEDQITSQSVLTTLGY